MIKKLSKFLILIILGVLSITLGALFYVYYSSYHTLNQQLLNNGNIQYGGNNVRLISYQEKEKEEDDFVTSIDLEYVTHRKHKVAADILLHANEVSERELFKIIFTPTLGYYLESVNGIKHSNKY